MKKDKEKLKKRLLKFAFKHIGKPYKWGCKKYEIGKYFDCSSFTQYLYKRIGIDLPRTTILQAYHGKTIPSKKKPPFFEEKELEIGDLLFFKSKKGHFTPEFYEGIGHVYMYLGNKKFISVLGKVPVYSLGLQGKKYIGMGEKEGVVIENFSKIVNQKDFQIAKRII
jgi:cell wall-associated NlpC family hydrolase